MKTFDKLLAIFANALLAMCFIALLPIMHIWQLNKLTATHITVYVATCIFTVFIGFYRDYRLAGECLNNKF